MKRQVLYLALSIFLLSFFSTSTVAAAPTTKAAPLVAITPAPQPEYILPYPGILPDNPLYFIKGFRDFILDKLIVDPIRKSEFYILQSDKRLNMGIFLEAKGKQVISEQVISKAEKYLQQAFDGFMVAKNSGKEIPGHLMDRIQRSTLKHKEVIETLLVSAAPEQKIGLTTSLDLVNKIQLDLSKLK